MKSIDEAEARARLYEILDEAQRQPIVILRQGHEVAIVVSMAEYDRLLAATVSEFLALRDDIAREASASGLTEDRLSELLNDD